MVWDVPVLIGGPAHGRGRGGDLSLTRIVVSADPAEEPGDRVLLTYTARKAGVTGASFALRYLAHEPLNGAQALAELWDWLINCVWAEW